MVTGGYTGSAGIKNAMTYNGTSWSWVGDMSVIRWSHSTSGDSADAITLGGENTGGKLDSVESFNGSTWANAATYTFAVSSLASGGDSSDAISTCGFNGTTYQSTCELYNGSSWTNKNSLSVARYEHGCGGCSSYAVAFGGRGPSIMNSTEEYDGTSWATGGNLNTARRLVSGGASATGSSGSGISISGYTTTTVQTVETYAWTIPSTEELIRILSENRQSSSGRLARFKPRLLWSPPTVLTTPTYDGSGQTVHPSVVYIEGGFAGYKYWMGITPYPNGNDDYENPSLLASNDGITWEVPSGITNPLATKPSLHNCDPCLVWNPDTGKLYYYYVELTTGPTWQIYRWEISDVDGVPTLGTKTALTISSPQLYSPAVYYNGPNDWVMWYYGDEGVLERRTSSDGLTWGPATNMSVFDIDTTIKISWIPWHVSVTKIPDGKYLFWIAAYPTGGNNGQTDLFWAIADNLTAPLKFKQTAFLAEFPGWGSGQVYHSSMICMENGTYRLYISAKSSSNVWRIGYADISLW
ncbi:MAG TPA: hypothetical protein PLY52_11295 [Methanothrix sp.]|nr:hypothetical protein [Methanothrix sp.]